MKLIPAQGSGRRPGVRAPRRDGVEASKGLDLSTAGVCIPERRGVEGRGDGGWQTGWSDDATPTTLHLGTGRCVPSHLRYVHNLVFLGRSGVIQLAYLVSLVPWQTLLEGTHPLIQAR